MPPTDEKDHARAGVTMYALPEDLASFVTVTSSTANAVIDAVSSELAKRFAKQIAEIEKERSEAAATLPITLE